MFVCVTFLINLVSELGWSSDSLLLDRETCECSRADFLPSPLVCLLSMGNDSFEGLNSLFLLPGVEHLWIELEVGVRLVLAHLEHITLALVTAVGVARSHHSVTLL